MGEMIASSFWVSGHEQRMEACREIQQRIDRERAERCQGRWFKTVNGEDYCCECGKLKRYHKKVEK